MFEQIIFDAETLNRAPYGACVTDSENTIVFWNAGAEALVGHSKEDAVGRRCYDVIKCRAVGGSEPLCAKGKGCPASAASQDADAAPGFFAANLRCASKTDKAATVAPLILKAESGRTATLNLFSERGVASDSGNPPKPIAESGLCAALTPRELEVVRLLIDGFDAGEIARELVVSVHTVLNHIRNARGKADARDKLELVAKAVREGMVGDAGARALGAASGG